MLRKNSAIVAKKEVTGTGKPTGNPSSGSSSSLIDTALFYGAFCDTMFSMCQYDFEE
jgi:hypothetical protein